MRTIEEVDGSNVRHILMGATVHGRGHRKLGVIDRVIVNPAGRVLTHLIVEPSHRRHAGRLVPVELIETTGSNIQLSCSHTEFKALADAEQKQFLAAGRGFATRSGAFYAQQKIAPPSPVFAQMGNSAQSILPSVYVHNVPDDHVEVVNSAQIDAIDGRVGEVRGLVADLFDYRVTYVLLREGRLRQRRDAAVPVNAVRSIGGGRVRLNITREQVRSLPESV